MCDRFWVQVSSFGNYIAEEDFKNTFVQQSHKNIVMNIKNFIDDQIFLMNQKKIDESKLNAFISEFLKKGRCQGGDELGMVVVESNFDGVHLILETNPEWFLGQGEVKSFAYSVYYTKATDGKYENTIYNKVDVQY